MKIFFLLCLKFKKNMTSRLIAPCNRLSYLNDWDEEAAGIAAVLHQTSLEGCCSKRRCVPCRENRPHENRPFENTAGNRAGPLEEIINGFRNEFRPGSGRCLAAPYDPNVPSRVRKCIDKGCAPCQELFTCRFEPQLVADTEFYANFDF